MSFNICNDEETCTVKRRNRQRENERIILSWKQKIMYSTRSGISHQLWLYIYFANEKCAQAAKLIWIELILSFGPLFLSTSFRIQISSRKRLKLWILTDFVCFTKCNVIYNSEWITLYSENTKEKWWRRGKPSEGETVIKRNRAKMAKENLPICRPVVRLCIAKTLFGPLSLWHFVVHQS